MNQRQWKNKEPPMPDNLNLPRGPKGKVAEGLPRKATKAASQKSRPPGTQKKTK